MAESITIDVDVRLDAALNKLQEFRDEIKTIKNSAENMDFSNANAALSQNVDRTLSSIDLIENRLKHLGKMSPEEKESMARFAEESLKDIEVSKM